MKLVTYSLAIVLSTALVAGPAAGAERRLGLSEAIALSLAANENLRIERESAAAAQAAVSEARGAYDQVLELEGSWQAFRDPANLTFPGAAPSWLAPEYRSSGVRFGVRQLLPTGGALALRASGARQTTEGGVAPLSPAYGTQLGLELRQPLLRDRAIDPTRLSVHVSTAEQAAADASLRRATNETVARVERAYWLLVAARLGVAVLEESARLAEEQLQLTEIRVGSGSAPSTELAQPRAELERRRGELLEGRERTSRLENDLKLLILAEDDPAWNARIAPAETLLAEGAAVDVAASIQRALANRPELDMAEALAVRRRVETRFAADGVRPSLDAVVSYDRYGLAGSEAASLTRGRFSESFESLRDGELKAARFALVLQLPIHNSSARASAEAARHFERQASAEIERVRKSIRAEVLDASSALETAVQRIEATRSGREAAEVQLGAEQDRYASGLSTNFLVLTRQNDLSRARLDEISALTSYRAARTELGRASGTLMDELRTHAETTTR